MTAVPGRRPAAGGPIGADGGSNALWQRGHHTRWLSRTFHRVAHREQT